MHPSDVLVLGAGVNGLVAAALLAKRGLKVLVLERSDRVGGCARTSEIAPGFRCPTLSHAAAIDAGLVRSLGLERHGLTLLRPTVDACAPTADGSALVLWRDRARACGEIRAFSDHDAGQYAQFLDSFERMSVVLRAIASATPPDIDAANAADIVSLLAAGRRFRSLRRADAYRLLRWITLPVGDLVREWFESEPLRGTIAAGGLLGSFLGPSSAGSGAVLLLLGAGEGRPLGADWFVKGGPGALADALAAAARAAGGGIRTGVVAARIDVDGDTATGVTSTSSDRFTARAVVSGVDPKRTLLGLVDPMSLTPETIRRLQNIRARGTLAKVNYAVSSMPQFASLANRDAAERVEAASGRVRLAARVDDIERAFDAAKYGGFSDEPWIELTIPSVLDPSLAPAGRHVVSAYVQYTPYHLRDAGWDAERDRLGDIVTRTIARYAPGFESSVVAREVITPLDLERTYGLTGGHIFHGELALDQWFVTRPMLGMARYATPVRRLYLCGSGTHPGTGLDGRSGANAASAIIRTLARDTARV